MRKIVFVLLFLLYVGFSFSEYRENVTVQVLSKDKYIVKGAEVIFVNELNSVAGKITSRPYITGDDGTVTHLLYNNEFDEAKTNTKFSVIVRYGNVMREFEFDLKKMVPVLQVELPLEACYIYVYNEYGQLVNDAIIQANGMTFTSTGGMGYYFLLLPVGKQNITVTYNELVRTINADVRSGAVYNVKMFAYKAKIQLVDSFEKPLEGILYIGNKVYEIPKEGRVISFGETANPTVIVNYAGKEKTMLLSLGTETEDLIIPFDIDKPMIDKNVYFELKDEGLTVKVRIEDPGKYKSGLSNVLFYYRTNYEEGVVPFYVEDFGIFVGVVKFREKPSTFDYTIEASDKEGNVNYLTGRYEITAVPKNEELNETPKEVKNDSQVVKKPQENNEQNILVYIGGAILVIIIVYLIYSKVVKKD